VTSPKTETPAKRTINPLKAAAVLAVTVLLARIVGFLQLSIISRFMDPADSDAYLAAFGLSEIVNYLVAGGAISITFIPVFTSLEHEGKKEDAWDFFSSIITVMTVALSVLIVIGMIFAEPLVKLTTPGFAEPGKEAALRQVVNMTRIMLPAQLFFYLGGLIVGVLNSHKRFAASGMTGTVYNLVAIVIGFILWVMMGTAGFAWGILFGAFAGNFLLPLVAGLQGSEEERLKFRFSFKPKHPAVARYFRNALPIMLGVSLPVVDQIVVRFFGSYLDGGGLSHLTYGNRVMLAPLGILAQAASVAAFPFMATDSATKNWNALTDFLRTGLRRLMFLALPISTVLILNARPIIDLLFGYGKFANDPNAVHQTSIAFAFYCVGLFAWAGQQFVARGFYALQDTVTPTVIGSVLAIFFFVPLCWFAAKFGGVMGLALATSVGAAAHFSCILIAFEMKLKRRTYDVDLHASRIMSTLLRTVCATAIMGLVGVILLRFFSGHGSKLVDLFQILVVSVISSAAFMAAAHAFKIPEWTWLSAKVLSRIGR
jgi:putative peptidoglycan lipid II flippase